jgi:hypothetical protein
MPSYRISTTSSQQASNRPGQQAARIAWSILLNKRAFDTPRSRYLSPNLAPFADNAWNGSINASRAW